MTERLRLLAATGIDAVLVLPFDAALARLTAREFVREILVETLGVRSLHEGGNFRFGHRAEAGVAELKEFGAEFGFAVHVHRRGAGARAGGFQFGDSRAGGRGRHAPRALDAGPAVRGALHAGQGPRHRHAAAGAHGEPGALRRACCRPSGST